MVLVDLDKVEVATFAGGEAVLAVELNLGKDSWVSGGFREVHLFKLVNFTRVELVVAPLVTNPAEVNVRAFNIGILLDDPDEFLNWVVEAELNAVGLVAD